MQPISERLWKEIETEDDEVATDVRQCMLPGSRLQIVTRSSLGDTELFLRGLSERGIVGPSSLLSRFDTPVALVESTTPRAYCNVAKNVIVVSTAFIDALNFSASSIGLTNLFREVRIYLARHRKDSREPGASSLSRALRDSQAAAFDIIQATRILHFVGQGPVPKIAELLPEEMRVLVQRQSARSAIFTLLHEQAHLELAKGTFGFDSSESTRSSDKEFLADEWALDQIAPEDRQSFTGGVGYFFLNLWLYDRLANVDQSTHPAVADRMRLILDRVDSSNRGKVLNDLATVLTQPRSFLDWGSDKEERFRGVMDFASGLGNVGEIEHLIETLAEFYNTRVKPPYGVQAMRPSDEASA